MSDYEVYIKERQVKFRIGVQTFSIDYEPTDDDETELQQDLEWMQRQLENALHELAKGGK